VIDVDGTSIKESYLLDCCYAIEVLGGIEIKTASALHIYEFERYPHVREATRRFAEIGIEVIDSSVFNACEPEHFKFIDFELVGIDPLQSRQNGSVANSGEQDGEGVRAG
jgi:hypothetical protein